MASRYGAMLSGVDPEGYASCCDALATADVTAELGRVQAPTLVLAGAEDPVVPPESATATMKAVRGSSLCVLAGAAHLANVEQPDTFNRVVLDHLAGPAHRAGPGRKTGRAGRRPRGPGAGQGHRAVRSVPGLPERVALGRCLARPGLERETRRLVAISILVALGRHEELELHLRAALRAGLSTTTFCARCCYRRRCMPACRRRTRPLPWPTGCGRRFQPNGRSARPALWLHAARLLLLGALGILETSFM